MPALNFKARFAEDVRAGKKRQTIRAKGKRPPPRVGDLLMLYTGMRQCGCRKLLDVVCRSVVPISISTASRVVQMVAGSLVREAVTGSYWETLSGEEIEQLARDDGFSSADDFFAFFAENHGKTFSGYLIKW